MLSKKIIKRYLPGLLAIVLDIIAGMILLNNVTSIYANSHISNYLISYGLSPILIIPLTIVALFSLLGSYKSRTSVAGHLSTKRPIAILTGTYIILLIVISYSEPVPYYTPRYLIKLFAVLTTYSVIISFNRLAIHLLLTTLLKIKLISHNVLIVFHNAPETPYLKEFLRYIDSNNLTLIGYCGTQKIKHAPFPDLPFLGKFNETTKIIQNHDVDEVIIFNHTQKTKQTEKIITETNTNEILIRLAPGTLESISTQIKSRNLTEIPVVSIHPSNPSLGYKIMKRLLDIFISLWGVFFTGLLYPIIAYKIRKSSPGPVIYKQERLGKNRKPFFIYKFRTMYIDAEKKGPQLASKGDDTRITLIGRILRRNHIDELPQFLNVLKGEMTIVGPRPEREYFANILEKEAPYYRFITKVKPGLTSLGMVKYGYAHDVKEMTERMVYDIIYINHQSIFADLQIIGNTMIYILKKLFFREAITIKNPPKTIHIQIPEEEQGKHNQPL